MSRYQSIGGLSLTVALTLVFFIGTAAAQENPVRRIDGWGQVVDPVGDCKLVEEDGKLSITVPGAYRDLHINLDAPRVMQDVEGDFVAQVRVLKFARPEPKSGVNTKNPVSYVSGGLLVWQDEQTYIRFQRAANGDSKFVGTFAQYYSQGKSVAFSRIELADEDTWLRVERKAGRFSLAQSGDGKTWTAVQPKGEEIKLPAKVKIGVFAINATNREIVHEYADFSLKRAAKPK